MVDDLKDFLGKGSKLTKSVIKKSDLLSSGSTLLNLSCTGHIEGAFPKGKYIWIVGDSSSGKSFFSCTVLAEASINSNFDGYRLIYDDVEGGVLMDIEKYFGSNLAERLEPPRVTGDGEPIYSDTDDSFYFHVDDAFEVGKPFVYILDSMDALSSEKEGGEFAERKKAIRRGRDPKGSYGDGKAKRNASGIRQLLGRLRDTKSILIILNQTRANIGATPFQPQKTYSGGHSLEFYATFQLWLTKSTAIKKKVKDKDRKIGVTSRVTVKKNRGTGRDRTVNVPIYYSYGIDDVGNMVDYLVEEQTWKKSQGVIYASDFDVKKKRDALIRYIEEEDLQWELKQAVKKTWEDIEEECELDRKSRY